MGLIDAEQFVTEMEINIGNVYNPDIIKGMRFAIELINSRPTAFDKEKVIEELNRKSDYARNRWLLNQTKEKHSKYWDGKENGFREAIQIVEKGGIE